jgi:hypothetical protein
MPKSISTNQLIKINLSNWNLAGNMNLVDFVKLKNINAYGNKFTKLDFLFTLPSKEKLE